MTTTVRRVTEVLIYEPNDGLSFEEFLIMVLERLKAARYCRRVKVEIIREGEGLEMKAILSTRESHSSINSEEEERQN
ncbi:MAG: hypothetical protein GXO26_09935 [Crenarchaeota archaeon]|nr:hypothetical protein [Thermoproteota archaeon]